ncbi:hypothetical protein RRG08_033364 [Elysia crispata]|uniref:Groucho/TLE N-terminal Q-rich domain-containing protein n=1 Tax=Elysia crispata TaxID=231223 RepID=A0AAE1DBF2_9GAST|nr:hypothetical protein RRG08_033364 [Elysia crispata]
MYPNRHPASQTGQPFKFTVAESCDRIKEEFSFLQAQYHTLKMECEKLAQEKTEMQRHYVMRGGLDLSASLAPAACLGFEGATGHRPMPARPRLFTPVSCSQPSSSATEPRL